MDEIVFKNSNLGINIVGEDINILGSKDNNYSSAPIDITEDYIRLRQTIPSKYIRFRTMDLGGGILAIVGFKKGGGSEVQSYLFKKSKKDGKEYWNLDDAKEWVKKHGGTVSAKAEDLFNKYVEVYATGTVINESDINENSLAKAGIKKNKDLQYVQFKLVHANKNQNKDRFLEEELAKSYDTPKLKPINWEHSDKIFGVMYDSKLTEDDDKTGEKAHIVVDSVNYKYKFPEETQIVANRYERGSLFYSMEVWFEEAECSICGGKFSHASQYCDHLRYRFETGSGAERILRGLTFGGAAVTDAPADLEAAGLAVAHNSNANSEAELIKANEQIKNLQKERKMADDKLIQKMEEDLAKAEKSKIEAEEKIKAFMEEKKKMEEIFVKAQNEKAISDKLAADTAKAKEQAEKELKELKEKEALAQKEAADVAKAADRVSKLDFSHIEKEEDKQAKINETKAYIKGMDDESYKKFIGIAGLKEKSPDNSNANTDDITKNKGNIRMPNGASGSTDSGKGKGTEGYLSKACEIIKNISQKYSL